MKRPRSFRAAVRTIVIRWHYDPPVAPPPSPKLLVYRGRWANIPVVPESVSEGKMCVDH